MAFNKSPQTWIPGIEYVASGSTVPANSLVIPMSSLPELTEAELEGANADIRRILFAVNDAVYAAWNSKPTADRPARMTLARQTTVNDALGVTTRNYTSSFVVTTGSFEVDDEPV
jgi:hypothetical protein